MDGFEQFWPVYPRKVGKKSAERAWNRLEPPINEVLSALAWQVYQKSWRDVQYIPYPATWLRAGRWEDEMPVIIPPQNRLTPFEMARMRGLK